MAQATAAGKAESLQLDVYKRQILAFRNYAADYDNISVKMIWLVDTPINEDFSKM